MGGLALAHDSLRGHCEAGSLSGLDLNMSAKEMRERIGSKKKKDARKENSMDFTKKLQIIQSL